MTRRSSRSKKIKHRNAASRGDREFTHQRVENKNILKKQLMGGAKSSSTAHLTIDAKRSKMRLFYKYVHSLGTPETDIADISAEHIVGFINSRRQAGKNPRTLQNDMAAIRTVLRHHKRDDLADDDRISCRTLGISNASRAGTKVAVNDEKYFSSLEIAQSIQPGLAACLKLERTLGLRNMEAIRSGHSLATWRLQLALDQPLLVIDGTKGGRPRDVHVVDPAAATEAVNFAIKVAEANGGTLLPNSLKKAYTQFRHKMNFNIKLQAHSLRYAFTRDRVEAYLNEGLSLAQALGRTAEDLGHGSGRGRWVKHVYLNGVELHA